MRIWTAVLFAEVFVLYGNGGYPMCANGPWSQRIWTRTLQTMGVAWFVFRPGLQLRAQNYSEMTLELSATPQGKLCRAGIGFPKFKPNPKPTIKNKTEANPNQILQKPTDFRSV